ncbi:hypothetical protein P43SY_005478 [Pythium insidiosum]|uniref:Centrosomal protein CEP104 N-terminal domain-containing protein n=1 Tax=Pythium insidiosum TaxID=114742 RepID=A0AAD5M3C3_PYTIN|nr:hypothetical protein P43SY_005478 [Pythium insidiosum]
MSDVLSLEPIVWSSEEDGSPASRLASVESAQRFQQLNDGNEAALRDAGWQSEKFCEYPQTIVFRINRGTPTVIRKLLILSHHIKIPSRIEIFVAMPSAHSSSVTNWKSARFERLGFVAFQRSQPTAETSTRELKSVPMPSTPVAFIKFLIHPCHLHSSNLFNQVGIVLVLAISGEQGTSLGDPNDEDRRLELWTQSLTTSSSLPSLSSAAKVEATIASFSPDGKGRLRHAFPSSPTLSSSAPHDVWLPERQEFASPTQILTRIQLARARAEMRLAERASNKLVLAPEDHILRSWRVDEIECQALCERLQRLQTTSPTLASSTDRLALRNEINAIVDALRALDEKSAAREREFQQSIEKASSYTGARRARRAGENPMTAFPGKTCLSSGADEWQAREEFVWSVNDALRRIDQRIAEEQDDDEKLAVEEIADEALQIAKTALNDTHPQVFVAASSLLATVLQVHPLFQDASAWKRESLESSDADRASAQRLHGLLKILAALLLSFHCCATIDIAPKRLLRVLLRCDAFVHEHALVREAARQLLLALHADIGSDVILAYLRKRKKPAPVPETVLRGIEELLSTVEQRAASTAS